MIFFGRLIELKKFHDERITSMTQKYGYQAFNLMIFLYIAAALISAFGYKPDWLYPTVFLASIGYFLIRCTAAGFFLMTCPPSKKPTQLIASIITAAVISLAGGGFTVYKNMIIPRRIALNSFHPIMWFSFYTVIVGCVYFTMIGGLMVILYAISDNKANKPTKDDEDL